MTCVSFSMNKNRLTTFYILSATSVFNSLKPRFYDLSITQVKLNLKTLQYIAGLFEYYIMINKC